jgi:hypothetical protein
MAPFGAFFASKGTNPKSYISLYIRNDLKGGSSFLSIPFKPSASLVKEEAEAFALEQMRLKR